MQCKIETLSQLHLGIRIDFADALEQLENWVSNSEIRKPAAKDCDF